MGFLRELAEFFIEEIMRGCDSKIDNIFSPYTSQSYMHEDMQHQMHEQIHHQHVQEHMDMAWQALSTIEFGGCDCISDMNSGMMDMGMF